MCDEANHIRERLLAIAVGGHNISLSHVGRTNQIGIGCCGVFYFGMALLVFYVKVLPLLTG
jgi:hypothetical protein